MTNAPTGNEPTRAQRDLIANVVEAWSENLYTDWLESDDDTRENEMVDAEEMFEDNAPGAVYLIRDTDESIYGMDAGNWRAVERAVELTVLGWDTGYEDAYDVTHDEIIAACAAFGLTADYFNGTGPRRGDQ